MHVALVTGGSKGIGLAVVGLLHAQGYKVVTCGRSLESWQQAVTRNKTLAQVDFQVIDLTQDRQVETLFDYIQGTYGTLSIAVNNAAPQIVSQGEYASLPVKALKATIDSDLWVPMLCMHYELNTMAKGACIVNVSSVNGLRPSPTAATYGAAKHALEALTKSLALESVANGIRINAVAPGVTWTPRWQQRQDDMDAGEPQLRQDLQTHIGTQVPMGRFAQAQEIAQAIVWLCSDQAQYIVGHTLVVDGGLSLQ